jgi:hypothetical protein
MASIFAVDFIFLAFFPVFQPLASTPILCKSCSAFLGHNSCSNQFCNPFGLSTTCTNVFQLVPLSVLTSKHNR